MVEMRVQVTLHDAKGDCLLFDGRPEQCPPLPRPGDQIRNQGRLICIEGIEYAFLENGTIHIYLLA
jgi:hypothetical protein